MCVCLCVHECRCLLRLDDGVTAPGAGFADNCELPDVGPGSQSHRSSARAVHCHPSSPNLYFFNLFSQPLLIAYLPHDRSENIAMDKTDMAYTSHHSPGIEAHPE